MSSIYPNVELKATVRNLFFSRTGFELILILNNTKLGLLTMGRHLYPWEIQQIVGRPDFQTQYRCCPSETQALFNQMPTLRT